MATAIFIFSGVLFLLMASFGLLPFNLFEKGNEADRNEGHNEEGEREDIENLFYGTGVYFPPFRGGGYHALQKEYKICAKEHSAYH